MKSLSMVLNYDTTCSSINSGAIFALLSLVGDQNIHRDLRQAGIVLSIQTSVKASSINCI